ncbi:aminotransferase class III-fold pyridoxal phosphate-dependent enzyme [Candidimonas sp. SYP-B2681]|uniref:aspartate aminotransferase family protein n=1 Tax=Candidimonas sp. SYP-B2681 TaxID=2497686 RepID=UPI000F877DB2|nr:aminotransferase class III-fold pyridoxal phosphate-dependent enzyme [Candidimonas sp. SYP-B2681]RTZ44420.1 aminotransferase class III-fold pyridoxal phosphate-dependent enzyme [Candidimonas sp. SYP-B2681]
MTTATSSLQDALQDAHARYAAANPKSLAQHRNAAKVLPGGNTRTVLFSDPFPVCVSAAEGCYVHSLDGDVYADYLGEYTAGLFGHSEPAIKEAVQRALDSGWVRGGHIPQEAELASLICERFPSIERVRFANSGTEANLYAIQTARAVSGKNKVVVFEGGYHGGVFVFSGAKSPITAPFDFIIAPYNDWAGTLALLEADKRDIACVLIEAHQGSGGCIPATPAFLKHIEAWANEHEALFILDEVMTSRLSGGGLQEVYGLKPDMTTLGKYIGGGFSFGAFGGRADIMERYNPLRPNYIGHAGTFNNNVFTMYAGVAGYGKVFTPEVAKALTAKGESLRKRLNKIARTAAFPMQFTGLGSMMNVHMCPGEITSTRDHSRSNPLLRDLFYFDMLEQGIWPARRGMLNLSLPMGQKEFDQLADAVSHFVETRRDLQI